LPTCNLSIADTGPVNEGRRPRDPPGSWGKAKSPPAKPPRADNGLRVSDTRLREVLPQVLESLPKEWRGTTFKNSNLLGREVFTEHLENLILSKSGTEAITTEELVSVGNAEDYLRVASNVSTTLEFALATAKGLPVTQVFTFASKAMPIMSVALTAVSPVHLYIGGATSPFTNKNMELLKLLGVQLTIHAGGSPQPHPGEVVLALDSAVTFDSEWLNSHIDAVAAGNVLYISHVDTVKPADITVIRKRMATPITTPVALGMLEEYARIPVTYSNAMPTPKAMAGFLGHLQTMSGTSVNPAANPVVFTAGLSALCSMYTTLISRGGADVLMCSTAYGGSSQLTDLLTSKVLF